MSRFRSLHRSQLNLILAKANGDSLGGMEKHFKSISRHEAKAEKKLNLISPGGLHCEAEGSEIDGPGVGGDKHRTKVSPSAFSSSLHGTELLRQEHTTEKPEGGNFFRVVFAEKKTFFLSLPHRN